MGLRPLKRGVMTGPSAWSSPSQVQLLYFRVPLVRQQGYNLTLVTVWRCFSSLLLNEFYSMGSFPDGPEGNPPSKTTTTKNTPLWEFWLQLPENPENLFFFFRDQLLTDCTLLHCLRAAVESFLVKFQGAHLVHSASLSHIWQGKVTRWNHCDIWINRLSNQNNKHHLQKSNKALG